MTEPTGQPNSQAVALTLWERIRWPHVVVFAIVVLGALGFAILLPDDRWGLVERVVISVIGGGGAMGWLVSGGALKAPHEIPPPASLPPRAMPRRDPPTHPTRREDGSTDAYALLMVAALGAALVSTLRICWPYLARAIGAGVVLIWAVCQ